MHPLHDLRPPRPRLAFALTLAFALAPACGDSGSSTTDQTTAPIQTTSTTAPGTTTELPTTEPATDTGTGTTTTTATTGAPGVCDGSMAANAFACQACTECGSWTTPIAGMAYPPALICLLEGMRDGAVVGADSQSCEQGKCLVNRLLGTGVGTMVSQYMILDQNDQSMDYQGIQELPLRDASYFEACLAAYDESCTSPNSWFMGESVNADDITCP